MRGLTPSIAALSSLGPTTSSMGCAACRISKHTPTRSTNEGRTSARGQSHGIWELAVRVREWLSGCGYGVHAFEIHVLFMSGCVARHLSETLQA